jgi:hypothetical protein
MKTREVKRARGLLKGGFVLAVVVMVLSMTGCATTSLVLKPSEETQAQLTRFKNLVVESSTSEGTAISEGVQNRMRDLIRTEIANQCRGRFENISAKPPGSQDLVLHVRFTKYDEGNRFARAMLAGLGSMKIHAEIEVRDPVSGATYCKGEAGKVFAWGGLYGASTGIEEIERDFAREVARGVSNMVGAKPASN